MVVGGAGILHGEQPGRMLAPIRLKPVDSVSVKRFGAMGDGVADDTAAIQNGLTAACFSGNRHLHFPAGVYNISTSLITGCAMFITGDGPSSSVIFMTVHLNANHGIIANYPLAIQDIAVNTAPIMADLSMVAVFRKDTFTPSAGQNYTFLRYNSSGFNFGIDVAGVGPGPDQIGAVVVQDCILATSTSPSGTAVSEPLNVRTAASLTAVNNLLIGDGNGDHGIYVIGIREVAGGEQYHSRQSRFERQSADGRLWNRPRDRL